MAFLFYPLDKSSIITGSNNYAIAVKSTEQELLAALRQNQHLSQPFLQPYGCGLNPADLQACDSDYDVQRPPMLERMFERQTDRMVAQVVYESRKLQRHIDNKTTQQTQTLITALETQMQGLKDQLVPQLQTLLKAIPAEPESKEDNLQYFNRYVSTFLCGRLNEAAAIARGDAVPTGATGAREGLEFVNDGAEALPHLVTAFGNPLKIASMFLRVGILVSERWERDTLKPIERCLNYLPQLELFCKQATTWLTRHYCLVIQSFNRAQAKRFADVIIQLFIQNLLHLEAAKDMGEAKTLDYEKLARDWAFEVVLSHDRSVLSFDIAHQENIHPDEALWQGGFLLWENNQWQRFRFTHKEEDKSHQYPPVVLRQADYPDGITTHFVPWYSQTLTQPLTEKIKASASRLFSVDRTHYRERYGLTVMDSSPQQTRWENEAEIYYPNNVQQQSPVLTK